MYVEEDAYTQPGSIVERRIKQADVIILDEVSMASPALLAAIDKRCTHVLTGNTEAAGDFTTHFGGLAVLICGDLFQLKVPHGDPFYEVALNHADGATLTRVGADLFVQFKLVDFGVDVRVGDATLQRVLSNLRAGDARGLADFIRSHAFDPTDPSFARAVVAVCGNAERCRLNSAALHRFAVEAKVPIFRWGLTVTAKADAVDPTLRRQNQEERKKRSKTRNPSLTVDLPQAIRKLRGEEGLADWYAFNAGVAMFEFAAGAPAMTSHNGNPARGYANGSLATMHSLWWPPELREDPELLELLDAARPGGVVDLPARLVPVVLVRLNLSDPLTLVPTLERAQRDTELVAALDTSADAGAAKLPPWLVSELAQLGVERDEFLAHLRVSVAERRAWPLDQTCVRGDAVVALPSIWEEETLSWGGQDAIKAKIKRPAVQACFSITVHKSQGGTITKLIVVLLKRPGGGNLTPYDFNNIYVALSRVRHGDDIRFVFNEGEYDWDTLQRPAPLVAFLSGYDSRGEWSRARASAKAAELREKPEITPSRCVRVALWVLGPFRLVPLLLQA